MSTIPLSGESLTLYRRLLHYVKPHWRVFGAACIGLAAGAATQGAFAALIKPMMDGTFVQRDPTVIKWTPVVMIALFLVNGLASYSASYGMSWVARGVIKRIRGDMFERLLHLPVTFFDNAAAGNLISKLIYDVEQVSMATTEAISVLIRDTLTIIALLFWMFYLNWQLAIILLIGAPVIAKVINTISRHARRYSSRIQNSVGDVAHVAEEAIEGQRVVKTFGGQGYEMGRFDEANERNRRLTMRLEANVAASVPLVQFIAAIASAGIIYVATSGPMLHKISSGAFVSFLAAMMMMYGPTKRLTRITVVLQRGIAAASSIFSFLDTSPESDAGTHSVKRCRGEVEYRAVTFGYAQEMGAVLHDIDLKIAAGTTVALVGRSGSGKSTMVSLLPRFYDVRQGQILLDGVDLHDIALENLRDQIALVSQHIVLFNDSIANNIAYGRLKGAGRDAVERAAEAAHAMEFIRELPAGLDTMVGENGVLLSGGQRQRLAIARALLKDAPLLILDEATSALDTQSERHIQQALEALMRNRTTLVIAHRLSTIENADCIVVMDKGCIVEVGRHQELLAQDGRYAALHRLQFRDEPSAAVVE